MMGNYCDGHQFSRHPLFSTSVGSLQLLLYYDGVEICNPLGLKRNKVSESYCVPQNVTSYVLIIDSTCT